MKLLKKNILLLVFSAIFLTLLFYPFAVRRIISPGPYDSYIKIKNKEEIISINDRFSLSFFIKENKSYYKIESSSIKIQQQMCGSPLKSHTGNICISGISGETIFLNLYNNTININTYNNCYGIFSLRSMCNGEH